MHHHLPPNGTGGRGLFYIVPLCGFTIYIRLVDSNKL